MDDWDDDFCPLSMSGVPAKQEKSELPSSQTSFVSRLSRSFRKRNQGPYAESNAGSSFSVPTTNLNQLKCSGVMKFCTLCQAPFEIIKIDPTVHAAKCVVNSNELQECRDGEFCYNDKVSHYQHYSHKILAQIRASKGHISPVPNPCGTPSSRRKSSNFKVPKSRSGSKTSQSLCKPADSNSPNSKRKLFSDCESLISISSSDITDASTTIVSPIKKTDTLVSSTVNEKECIKGKTDDVATIAPSHSSTPKRSTKELIAEINKLNGDISACESEKISACSRMSNRIDQRKLVSDIRTSPSKGIEQSDHDSDFRTPPFKRRSQNFVDESKQKKHRIHNLVSNEILNTQKNAGSNSKNRNVTILDTLDCDINDNESNLECEKMVDVDCDCNEKIKLCSLERCGSSKGNEDEIVHLSQDPREVRATMSIVVSPTDENLEDCIDETPVKVDASCNKLGWRTVEIAAPTTTEIDNVNVSVCKCTKKMEINCSLSKSQAETSPEKNVHPNKELQVKFFSHVSELTNKKHDQKIKPEAANRQMAITSFFRASKQPSTLSLKTSIESVEAEIKPFCSSDLECQDDNLITNDVTSMATASSLSKQNKESVVASWKQIMKGMVQKGQSTLSVMSDDSIATTITQTSVEEIPQNKYRTSKKTCPFYKKIPDTSFVVDAFQYGYIPGVSHYFLSHFHYDHYGGLTKSFSKPIYCSKITAALVKLKLRVDERHIHVLEQDTQKKICGVLVTALDANHCPGSVMFLFTLQDGRNFLHVGDFRADPKMESYPCFWNLTIDKLFLDTTYCEPKYDFPLQSEIITRVTELAMEHDVRAPSTLFVCGTYTIGKEKVFVSIAEALNCKIWAHPDKRKILDCINNPDISERLTARQLDAQVHVCRMYDLNYTFLQRYLKQHCGKFSHLVAFAPTGWEIKGRHNVNSDGINMTSYGCITIYGVPYSEHSSFSELRRFVQFLKPEEIIPTVNVEQQKKRNAMQKHFRDWLTEPSNALQTVNHENKHIQQKMNRYFHSSKLNDA